MKFQIEESHTEEIEGLEVKYTFLSAMYSPKVLGQLLSDAGHLIAEYFANADVEVIKAMIIKASGGEGSFSFDDLLDGGLESLRDVAASEGLKDLLDRVRRSDLIDIDGYAGVMLPGIVSVGGIPLRNRAHLDELGASPLIVGRIIWGSLKFNFGPTLGARHTSVGSASEEPTKAEVTAAAIKLSKTKTTTSGSAKRRSRGAAKKGGR